MIYDAAIIGSGPAGVAAALNLKIHEKNFIWLGSKNLSDKVSKAEKISNYPGLANVTGQQLNDAFKAQVQEMGIEISEQMVNQILVMDDHYALLAGPDFYETKTIILATGIVMSKGLAREEEFVGRGVSYCATCDGGLYRNKTIAVVCNNPRFEHEVRYLAKLAQKVYFAPLYKGYDTISENVEIIKPIKAIDGEMKVSGVELVDGSKLEVSGIFFLRDSINMNMLLPDLEKSDNHIKVDRSMATNLKGVWAAGDCTGRPYQYSKAVGEGNVASHSVIEYLDKLAK